MGGLVRDRDARSPWPNEPRDYSGPSAYRDQAAPHDLVCIAPGALPDDLPAWACRVMASGAPAVVRRAPRVDNRLPIGIRGADKQQRCATAIDADRVTRRWVPEAIDTAVIETDGFASRRAGVPAFASLAALAPDLTATGLAWGVTGALAYELVTGQAVAHARSDIDLVVRMPIHDAAILEALGEYSDACRARFGVRCDMQLETPAGGVALADWRGAAPEVMVKSDTGPYLTPDPWRVRS